MNYLSVALLTIAICSELADDTNLQGSVCGGNCPTQTCGTCICGYNKVMVSVAQTCARYSGWSSYCCECVANQASGGKEYAMWENYDKTYWVGFLMIPQAYWAACNNGIAPCDVNANLNCALYMFQLGGNTWSLFDSTKCGCQAMS